MNTPQAQQAANSRPQAGSSEAGHNYVDISALPWLESRLPLSEQKVLYSDPVTGMLTVLVRMQPGGVIPYHEHADLEQTYVLKGRMVDGSGECTAGNFVWRAPGSRHSVSCPEGAEFIVFFMKKPIDLSQP